MKPQKNKARPKRPQFFFTGIAESSTVSRALVRLEQEAHCPLQCFRQPRYKPQASSPALQSGVVPGRATASVAIARFGCEQPVTQDLHFFRSERLYISGWLTLPRPDIARPAGLKRMRPTSAEVVCPVVAPSWDVRRLQQHIMSVSPEGCC